MAVIQRTRCHSFLVRLLSGIMHAWAHWNLAIYNLFYSLYHESTGHTRANPSNNSSRQYLPRLVRIGYPDVDYTQKFILSKSV